MSEKITKSNPFELNYGYLPNHDIAMTGFGLTVDSVYHWLFDQNLNTDPMGYLNAVYDNHPTEDQINDLDGMEITDWLGHKLPKNEIAWIDVANSESGPMLMMFDVGPAAERQVVKSIDEINHDLIETVTVLFNVDDAHQASLKEFVNQYADAISICDFS